MKNTRVISILLALAAAMLVVNFLAVPLPDWTVRTAGVVMLLALPSAAYRTVKSCMKYFVSARKTL